MKVRATTTGVYVPAGFFSLREGEEYDVATEVGKKLVDAGVAERADKQQPRGKRVAGAPENKGS